MAIQDDDDQIIDLDKNEDELDDSDRGDNLEEDELDIDEEEGLEEDDDDQEDEVDEEEEDRDDKIKIPKSRFDQVNERYKETKEREKWLESQLERLLNSQKKDVEEVISNTPYDFEEAEEKYISLIVEGEVKEAAKLRGEINSQRAAIEKAYRESIKAEAAKEFKQAQDTEKFNLLIENFESKYKFLDPNSKKYNAEAVDTINTLMAGFLAKGVSRADSLEKAVKKVIPFYAQAEEKKTVASDKRTLEQKKKNIQAIKKTPPVTSGRGGKTVDIDTIDINNLSEKEFAKLDKRTLAKLRGDI